jgi:integrase
MPLTDAAIRAAKASEKQQKLFDGGGLYLLVLPSGAKLWRLKYRFQGREKLISLGAYPAVGLAAARQKRDDERKRLAAGGDPSALRKAEKAAATITFEAVARECFETLKPTWTPSTLESKVRRMELYVFPVIGKKPVHTVTAADVLSVLRKIEARETHHTAHRVRQLCSQVMRYAIASGRAENDPTSALRGALVPETPRHRAAVTEPKKAGELLRIFEDYQGTLIVSSALRLAPLVFVRPGELRKAEWTEFDLDKAEWTIPAFRMKMRQSLTVPLSQQAVAILRKLWSVTGDGKYVFPSYRTASRPMSDNAVLAALRRSGIPKEEMTGHGFRAMARTILDEVLGYPVHLIEMQLAHTVRDPLGTAYNRTSFLPERRKMMQAWADYLDGLKNGDSQASTSSRHAVLA